MPITVTMPKLSPTMTEGTIFKWHKKEGDKVKAGDLLLEVATDKATVEYNSLEDGYLRKILVPEGESARVNQPIAIFTSSPDEKLTLEKKAEKNAPPSCPVKPAAPQAPAFAPEPPIKDYRFEFPQGNITERVLASPLAKKIAREKGLDLTTVKGTGPSGRIMSRDLEMAQPDQKVTFGRREVPDIAPGSFLEVPLSPMRKIIGERMQESKQSIPHFYLRQEIDAAALAEIREQLKSDNIHLTVGDFIIRAAALSLREHPLINSGFNSAKGTLILYQSVDIAVAVSVEEGLFTPIIRFADYKNIGEISVEIKDLSARAKKGKLKEVEYKGGSFTISNLGMIGVTDFAPIINPPQAAILGVGGIADCPRIKDGCVIPGKQMNLVLSCDHRVIDGMEGGRFIKTLQAYLENPSLLLV